MKKKIAINIFQNVFCVKNKNKGDVKLQAKIFEHPKLEQNFIFFKYDFVPFLLQLLPETVNVTSFLILTLSADISDS